ncbi:TPA: helix-turn-helix transcriptional regulator, partial [Listeria monocytogenes]|nr:helix-turn-helix transcriptional regulator [Listeria monocytogenes]
MRSIEIDKKKLGLKIKSIRLTKGLNQGEFGALFTPGADKSIVSRWEKGISIPSADRLKIISEIGNITIDDLIYGTIEEALRNLLQEAETFYEKKGYQKNDVLADSITDTDTFVRLSLLNTISGFKHNSYFNTSRPKCFKKAKEDWSETELQEVNNYYMLEDMKGSKSIMDMALDEAFSKNLKPTDEIELLKVLAYCSELLFNDEAYTNQGLLNFVSNNISEIFEEKLSNFTQTAISTSKGKKVVIRENINPELVEELEMLYNKIHEKIECLEE